MTEQLSTEIVTADPVTAAELAGFNARMHVLNQARETLRLTVAKDASPMQLELFLHQCAKYDLDPIAKEVWCVNMGQGIQIFAGRDGFLKLAQRNPDFDGLASETVCENDEFEYQPVVPEVRHTMAKHRGRILGAYAIVHHKNRRPTIYYATFEEYERKPSSGKSTPWQTFPSAMIKKVAEANALKRAFGISGFNYGDPDEANLDVRERLPRAVVDEQDPMRSALGAPAEEPAVDEAFLAKANAQTEAAATEDDEAAAEAVRRKNVRDEAMAVMKARGWHHLDHKEAFEAFKAECAKSDMFWADALLYGLSLEHEDLASLTAFVSSLRAAEVTEPEADPSLGAQ